jgi:transcriptional regulator with XRE-family HTH domain
MHIQKLRLKHGWSQQQLADMSGISARTIQRIEAGQTPSMETLKSLAAVFDVPYQEFAQESDMTSMAQRSTQPSDLQEQEAFAYVRKLRGFYRHLAKYLLVIPLLAVFNLLRTPQYLWFLWVAGGWGAGILLHAASVFAGTQIFGPEWEKRQVEKRLGRPL